MPFISFDPDEMSGGGLATDFDGVITRARFIAWNFPKENGETLDEYLLVAKAYIRPDDPSEIPESQLNEEGLIEHYWSCGSQKTATIERHFVPSEDGEEPVDLDSEDPTDWEGRGFIAVEGCGRTSLAGGSNFAHFLKTLKDIGYTDFAGDLSVMDGIHAHFDRVQVIRKGFNPGRKREGEEERVPENLVISKILGKAKTTKASKTKAKKGAAAKKKAASKKAADAAANGERPMGEWLTELVGTAIAEGKVDHFDQLPSLVLKSWSAVKDEVEGQLKEATAMVQSDEFLNSEEAPWEQDEEGGLSL